MGEFSYGKAAIEHLSKSDPVLGEWIDKLGEMKRPHEPDIFRALCWSILGQQVSTAAQEAAWAKLNERVGGATPEKLLFLPPEAYRECGISFQKSGYIRSIADAVLHGRIVKSELEKLTDEEVIKKLREFKGVGVWTAEMVLIFCMMRPDVLSFGDLGIRRGISRLHGLDSLNEESFEKYKKLYSPYGSAAALYLWEIGAMKR